MFLIKKHEILSKMLSNTASFWGLVITCFMLAAFVFGAMLMPYSPVDPDWNALLRPPSSSHPFGTDALGRDVLTRVLYGGRISFLISTLGVLFGCVIGVTFGLFSAYVGGLLDNILMRISDLLFAFPSFVLALFLMVVLGFGAVSVVFAIALTYFPIFARLTRNTALLIKDLPYIHAARLMGQRQTRILFIELLPNISAPIITQIAIGIAFGIVIESGLSFLGLGVQPPTPTLGTIMAEGIEYFRRAPWVLSLTGFAISIGLLGLNLMGDGLRDALDPRLREKL